MEQVFDLKALPVLDSMHDQKIQRIEIIDNVFMMHYENLRYDVNKEYRSCSIAFLGVEEADIVAEVRTQQGSAVKGVRYYDVEFVDFINNHKYSIETIYFYLGYEKVVIEAALVNKDGTYCEDCVIKISAEKVKYCWH